MFLRVLIFSLLVPLSLYGRELFTPKEKEELKRLKSKEFTFSNYKKELEKQNAKRLAFILKKMSLKDKELLEQQLKNRPWSKLEEKDTKAYMNKWISNILLDK